MKKYITTFLVFLFIGISAIAQNFDIILKTNGEEMEGNVKALNDDSISFIYKNEAIEYNVKTSDVVKITFASGRVQFFNKFDEPGNSKNVSLEGHHNKVAVLPFAYIKDQREGDRVMSNKIQSETFALLNRHRGGLTYQNTNDTNALLIKAGVTNSNIQGYTMGEICNILGVEFVVQGVVSVEKTTQQNYNSYYETTKNKGDNKVHVDSKGHLVGNPMNDGKSQSYGSSSSSNVQNYATSMTINVYNDKGNSIYSQDHTSFWNTQDAYKITLKYLAKRMPLYKK